MCLTLPGQVCRARGAHKMFRLKWNLDATPENKKRKVFMRGRRNNTKFPDTIPWDESSRALQTCCRKSGPPGVAASPPREVSTPIRSSRGLPFDDPKVTDPTGRRNTSNSASPRGSVEGLFRRVIDCSTVGASSYVNLYTRGTFSSCGASYRF